MRTDIVQEMREFLDVFLREARPAQYRGKTCPAVPTQSPQTLNYIHQIALGFSPAEAPMRAGLGAGTYPHRAATRPVRLYASILSAEI